MDEQKKGKKTGSQTGIPHRQVGTQAGRQEHTQAGNQDEKRRKE
jgi:hypothetical protein